MGVVSDADGTAARPPLVFDSRPLLLTQGGMCIVSGEHPWIKREMFSQIHCVLNVSFSELRGWHHYF